MSESDNYVKILEKLSDVREDIGVVKSETQHLKSGMAELKTEIENVKDQDVVQNKLLDEHIRGVESAHQRLDNEIQARKDAAALTTRQIEDMDSKLKKALEIPDTLHKMKKFLQWFSIVLAGFVALAEYLRHS